MGYKYRIDAYDDSTPEGILQHARKLQRKTFAQIVEYATRGEVSVEQAASGSLKDFWKSYSNKSRKGGLGNLLEEVYFGYAINSKSEPDFKTAGIELKATPYEKTKAGEYRAGERLVLMMIPHDKPIEARLEDSHLWKKCANLLIICYLRTRGISNLLYSIDYVDLFTPPAEDMPIIRSDYRHIARTIQQGRANELSEGDTIYLGACTKGADAESSLKPQFYAPTVPAKTRAWCYKQSYMTVLLQGYFAAGKHSYGRIFAGSRASLLNRFSFAQALDTFINKYIGLSVGTICSQVGLQQSGAKNFYNMLAVRMLGVAEDFADEFLKAGIKIKAIRLERNGKMNEHFRLFDADFDEIDKVKTFEESDLYRYLEESTMYVLVFKSDGKEYIFRGAFLWHIPGNDMPDIEKDFLDAREIIRKGIEFTVKPSRVTNNLPNTSETAIMHLRTHSGQTYYMFADKRGNVGKGSKSNTVAVPHTGHRCTRHSYWINKDYMLQRIAEHLGEDVVSG